MKHCCKTLLCSLQGTIPLEKGITGSGKLTSGGHLGYPVLPLRCVDEYFSSTEDTLMVTQLYVGGQRFEPRLPIIHQPLDMVQIYGW